MSPKSTIHLSKPIEIEHSDEIMEKKRRPPGRPRGSGVLPFRKCVRIGDKFFVQYKRNVWASGTTRAWNRLLNPWRFDYCEGFKDGVRGVWIQRTE